MKPLCDGASFSFEAESAAGFANRHRERTTATEQTGRKSLAAGHRVSAREASLRASNYYGTAEFYLRDNPASAPEVAPPAAHRAVFDRLGVILATPRPDMA
jgi:hypothetical protein